MSKKRNNNNRNNNYSNPSKDNADITRSNRGSKGDGKRNANKNMHSAPAILAKNGYHEPNRAHNDPEWFKDSRGLVDAAARYGNYQPTGRAWLWNGYSGDDNSFFGVPSALMCEYIPVPGISQSSTSAMSIAAQQIYQHVRRSLNKVLTGYQFADVVIAYTAFMSLVIQAKEMIRDYKIANSWSSDNFSYPYGILRAMGYNSASARDLITNMANYRLRFNTLMYQASSIFLPFETNHLLKYKWMSSGLWGDKDNPKAQVYGYTSMGYYLFTETEDPDDPGSKAVFKVFDYDQRLGNNVLFKTKLDHFEVCVKALRDSDSFNYMMSDLRTAYSDINGYVFDSLDESESISIDYNDVMLRQFQNIRTLPPIKHEVTADRNAISTAFTIDQDISDNSVICHPDHLSPKWLTDISDYVAKQVLQGIEDTYFDTHFLINWGSSAPEVNDVIETCNGSITWQFDKGNSGIELDEGAISCYVPFEFHMVYPSGNGTFGNHTFTSYILRQYGLTSDLYDWLTEISMFDWFPIINDVEFEIDASNIVTDLHLYPYVEDDVLAPISLKQLADLNKAEQYALWGVAQTANIG